MQSFEVYITQNTRTYEVDITQNVRRYEIDFYGVKWRGVIDEAPTDGNQYARKDAGWVAIEIPSAPIQSISVNGTDIPPVDGNVDITIPDAPVQSISVNGTLVEPVEGNVDINVPTKLSELENDADYVVDADYIHTDNNLTDELKSSYDGAVTLEHSHANKDALDLVSGTNTGDQDLSGLVPYTGATADVDLGVHSIATSGVKLNTVNPLVVSNPGEIGWNATDGTADLRLLNNSTLQLGQELHFYGKAVGAINNGDVVQFAGVQGDHILIKQARPAEIDVNPFLIIGIATDNISNGLFGYVTWFGKVNDVFTTGWNTGDLLYFDNSNNAVYGKLTNVEPSVPKRKILVAAVIKVATGSSENGKIIVRPTFSQKFVDLDDVNGTPLTESGQFAIWDNTLKHFDFIANINDYATTSDLSSYQQGTGLSGTDLLNLIYAGL